MSADASGLKRLALIPARGGSKRIPRKNIIDFHGKPMLGYSVDAALERLEPEQIETLSGRDDIRISKLVSVENKYLWFRCSKPPFDNPLLRRAACHAIDRELIYEVLGESGHPSANFISPIKFGYIDLDNYPEYDPDECQRLLAEAGGRPLRARQPATRHAGVSRLGELGVHGLMFLLVPRVTTRPGGACGCSSVGRAQPCQG